MEEKTQGVEAENPQEIARPYERQVGNWIKAYLEYTKESESPDNYHLWCAMSSLASVVRRNVWVDQGLYVLFPNLYIAFVGPPARTAKTTAMYLAKTLIRQVASVKMGPDSCTREQLIKFMAESKFDNQCAVTIHCGEFSDLIGPSKEMMIQFLMSIYDGNYIDKSGWEYQTKHQGQDKVINPYLNMIFCTTPTYFAEAMPESIIGHGFTSRTIIIFEDRERLQNSRPIALDSPIAHGLVADLNHISRLRGQFTWGGPVVDTDRYDLPRTDSQKFYDEYYKSLYDNPPQDHRIEGFHFRKKTHILKLAMLLSLAERDTLTIEKQDIEVAVAMLDDIEPAMVRAFSAVGKNEMAAVVERIGNQIRNAGEMSMAEVYKLNYSAGSDWDIDRVMVHLEKMGTVRRLNKLEDGKPVPYVLSTANVLPWAMANRPTSQSRANGQHIPSHPLTRRTQNDAP